MRQLTKFTISKGKKRSTSTISHCNFSLVNSAFSRIAHIPHVAKTPQTYKIKSTSQKTYISLTMTTPCTLLCPRTCACACKCLSYPYTGPTSCCCGCKTPWSIRFRIKVEAPIKAFTSHQVCVLVPAWFTPKTILHFHHRLQIAQCGQTNTTILPYFHTPILPYP